MSRKATAQLPQVKEAIALIGKFCEENDLCPFGLSQAVGVSQSALSRFLSGGRKAVTPTAKKCIAYICASNNKHKWHKNECYSSADDSNLIEEAARSLWDGDPSTVEFVASFLITLKPTVEVALAALRKSQQKS